MSHGSKCEMFILYIDKLNHIIIIINRTTASFALRALELNT